MLVRLKVKSNGLPAGAVCDVFPFKLGQYEHYVIMRVVFGGTPDGSPPTRRLLAETKVEVLDGTIKKPLEERGQVPPGEEAREEIQGHHIT